MINKREADRIEKTLETQLMERVIERMRDTIHEVVHQTIEGEIDKKQPETGEQQERISDLDLREIRNGVVRPAPGGKCDAVWSNLDRLHKKGQANLEAIRKVGERKGWNPNNTRIEFYRWRKFHALNE